MHKTNWATLPQKDYWNGKFRALAYFVWVAVKRNQHPKLVQRLKAVNGDNPSEQDEVIKASVFHDYGVGMNEHDLAQFLDWFLGQGLLMVGSYQNITAKLKAIKHERLCKIHVMCPDGKVPQNLSMTLKRRIDVEFLFSSQEPQRLCRS